MIYFTHSKTVEVGSLPEGVQFEHEGETFIKASDRWVRNPFVCVMSLDRWLILAADTIVTVTATKKLL